MGENPRNNSGKASRSLWIPEPRHSHVGRGPFREDTGVRAPHETLPIPLDQLIPLSKNQRKKGRPLANKNVIKAAVVFALKEAMDNKGVGISQMIVKKLIARLEENLWFYPRGHPFQPK